MSTFGAEFQLSTMTPQDEVKINGENKSNYAGSSVSSASDIDGDGFDDLIVGASAADQNAFNSGVTYIIYASRRRQPLGTTT